MPDHAHRALRAVLLGSIVLLSAAPFAAGTIEDYNMAIAAIRCDCGCHPQSVEDCACGRAEQMRDEVAAMVEGRGGAEPMTGEQVIADYVARQGEQILIAPSAVGFNLVAWTGPIVALVLGLIAAIVIVRKLSAGREPLAAAAAPASAPIEQDDPYRERLQRQLAEWD